MFGAGCNGCNFERDFTNIYINNTKMESYMADKKEDINYVLIEPVTGVMTAFNRSYTMVVTLDCYDRNTIGECS